MPRKHANARPRFVAEHNWVGMEFSMGIYRTYPDARRWPEESSKVSKPRGRVRVLGRNS